MAMPWPCPTRDSSATTRLYLAESITHPSLAHQNWNWQHCLTVCAWRQSPIFQQIPPQLVCGLMLEVALKLMRQMVLHTSSSIWFSKEPKDAVFGNWKKKSRTWEHILTPTPHESRQHTMPKCSRRTFQLLSIF